MFEIESDYQAPLLRVLSDMPGGAARKRDVLVEFMQRFGHRIPPKHHEMVSSNMRTTKWDNHLSWSRQHLVEAGYMDAPETGVWRITERGRRWLVENPNGVDVLSRAARRGPRVQRTPKTSKIAAPLPAGLSLEMLEKTRQAMGDELFRPLWGALYDQLLAAERTRAVTEVSDAELGKAARRQVRQIHDYLQGRGAAHPTGEQLCDWIHFAYQFSLYREAAALFPLVGTEDVNPWYLERTRKIAAACRSRL